MLVCLYTHMSVCGHTKKVHIRKCLPIHLYVLYIK